MFQIKDFRSIVASMLNVARASQSQLTDFSVGSVARTLIESPAVEIEELYLQMLLGLQDAIPVAIYQAFDFPIVSALPASGLLTLHFVAALTQVFLIPAHTTFRAPATRQTFYTMADVVAPIGSTQVNVTLVAATPGAAGNVPANAISQLGSDLQLPTGVSFTNLAYTSGQDSETDLVRKSRFIQFVLSLSRGTVQAVQYGASLASVRDGHGQVQEYVDRVGFVEEPGLVHVYLRGSAGAPSSALIANAQQILDGYVDPVTLAKIDGYRSAGVQVIVAPMLERTVSFGVSVLAKSGVLHATSLETSIVNAVGIVVASIRPGQMMRADALVTAVLGIDGVLSCYLVGASNIVCGQNESLVPTTISVTWLANA